ncbi:hypothetical protein BZA77DRAFT_293573 [Pyronema omphalodes]|nr:hypothetical protein BZA77DRAFT_293573 [Pyronema omphalodes]
MKIISVIALLVTAVAAAPPQPSGLPDSSAMNVDRPFYRGNPGGVYYCDDIYWEKTCHYDVYELWKCHDLPDEWNDTISSFGPDRGTYCFVYEWLWSGSNFEKGLGISGRKNLI